MIKSSAADSDLGLCRYADIHLTGMGRQPDGWIAQGFQVANQVVDLRFSYSSRVENTAI